MLSTLKHGEVKNEKTHDYIKPSQFTILSQ